MKINEHTLMHKGYHIRVDLHHDEDMGPPWEEHDGHGPVTNWTTRSKAPGELVLCQDGSNRRYYDFSEAVKIALRDGWDSQPYNKGGHETKRQQATKAAMSDFKHLQGWCEDRWQWLGYTTTIQTPNGEEINGDSCWGIDDETYLLEMAESNAKAHVDSLIEDNAREAIAAFDAACRDVATV